MKERYVVKYWHAFTDVDFCRWLNAAVPDASCRIVYLAFDDATRTAAMVVWEKQ